MAKSEISLVGATAFYEFNVEIAGQVAYIKMHWSTIGEFYRVTITLGDDTIVKGKGLHPGIDLLKSTDLEIGQLYLEGITPTLENIGIDNRLIYESV